MEEQKGLQQGQRPCLTPPMLVNEIARLFHCEMKNYDLTGVMSQDSARLIMRELARREGVSQLYLTNVTHLKAPTVSVTLKKMENEGLVTRVQDEMDLRMTRVFLTEKGRAHNRGVFERLKSLDARLMQGFSDEETETVLRLLLRMRENILPADKEKHTAAK